MISLEYKKLWEKFTEALNQNSIEPLNLTPFLKNIELKYLKSLAKNQNLFELLEAIFDELILRRNIKYSAIAYSYNQNLNGRWKKL